MLINNEHSVSRKMKAGDLFRLYIVNHYVKMLHVRRGVQNNMHPLSCGRGHKRKRSKTGFPQELDLGAVVLTSSYEINTHADDPKLIFVASGDNPGSF